MRFSLSALLDTNSLVRKTPCSTAYSLDFLFVIWIKMRDRIEYKLYSLGLKFEQGCHGVGCSLQKSLPLYSAWQIKPDLKSCTLNLGSCWKFCGIFFSSQSNFQKLGWTGMLWKRNTAGWCPNQKSEAVWYVKMSLFTILLIELKGITGVEKGLENFNALHWKLAGV